MLVMGATLKFRRRSEYFPSAFLCDNIQLNIGTILIIIESFRETERIYS